MSSDKSMLFLGTLFGTLYCVTLKSFERISILAHDGAIIEAISGDPGTCITISATKFIRIWVLATQVCETVIHDCTPGTTFVYSAKHKQLYTDFNNIEGVVIQSINVDTFDGELLRGHTQPVVCMKLLDDDTLVSSSNDCDVRIWDLYTNKCIRVLRGHQNPARGIAIAPDMDHIITVSRDRYFKVWKRNGECVQTYDWPDSLSKAAVISDDGKYVAVMCQHGTFTVCRIEQHFPQIITSSYNTQSPGFMPMNMYIDEHGRILRRDEAGDNFFVDWELKPDDIVRVDDAYRVLLLHKYTLEALEKNRQKVSHSLHFETPTDISKWIEIICATRTQLSLPQEEKVEVANVILRYRFDVFQMINQMDGGKGLVPGNTVPVETVKLIGYYL